MYIDSGSLFIVLLIPLSMMIFSNVVDDFWRAIKISMGQTEFTTKEFKASLNAIELSIKCVFVSGLVASMAGIIVNLVNINVHESVFTGFAIACIAFMYSLIINTVQYAIKTIIKKELIYRSND